MNATMLVSSRVAATRPAAKVAQRRAACVVRASKDAEPAREAKRQEKMTKLNSTLAPLAGLLVLGSFQDSLQPIAAQLNEAGLPEALVRWGHPGNMFVVLAAMGGYGSYLGWQIRLSDDADVVAKAQDMHPKLLGGAAVFFFLGAFGGMLSLTMQGKPILQSPHFWTGTTGLTLLALQAMLPLFFEDDPNARSAHAYIGSATMALLVAHAAAGLNLGLSL
ncbi:unnamed protein product [Pedinophyceae sp. YPF-701]|nr:unnamed protein product [Pedinophyceae sp. YPF-701]